MRRFLFWAAVMAGAAVPAAANDSVAAIGLGGLELRSTGAVAMVSEELTINPDRVHVRYVYRNETDAPVSALVAFPLPEYRLRLDAWEMLAASPGDMDFTTSIDGQEVALAVDAIARLDGVVRSADLQRLGLPLQVTRWTPMRRALEGLTDADLAWLHAEGLLDAEGVPQWTLQTVFTREQVFPPGADVIVEHSYRPFVGEATWSWFPGPEDTTVFEEWARRGVGQSQIEAHETFCPTDAIRARGRAQEAGETGIEGYHAWVSSDVDYVLTTGANWRGPIGHFRLVIEAADPWDVVLVCLRGARWVSQSRVEFEAHDFTPEHDLAIHFAVAAADGPQAAREAGLLPPPFTDVSPGVAQP